MSVIKTITLSDVVYAQWVTYKQKHPEITFNGACREALVAYMQHNGRPSEEEEALGH